MIIYTIVSRDEMDNRIYGITTDIIMAIDKRDSMSFPCLIVEYRELTLAHIGNDKLTGINGIRG